MSSGEDRPRESHLYGDMPATEKMRAIRLEMEAYNALWGQRQDDWTLTDSGEALGQYLAAEAEFDEDYPYDLENVFIAAKGRATPGVAQNWSSAIQALCDFNDATAHLKGASSEDAVIATLRSQRPSCGTALCLKLMSPDASQRVFRLSRHLH
ncbi:MAG: hypothetical protein M9891_13640 [Austwickia sp.]|nr:hypothetical protein [Actinomycetota bacterium]MCO5310299.1 hypothetical protein [Austwickia sp.]